MSATSSQPVVMIDNYDSFTWNIYQYLATLHPNVLVFRNDATTVDHIRSLNPSHLVISPGPGHPRTDAGISRDCILAFSGIIPILGVCLGQQCMYEVFGGVVDVCGEIVHGKASNIIHDGRGVYLDIPKDGVQVTRYHSLAGTPETLPKDLIITSATQSGVIMGVRHRKFCVEGVQFHPESILSGQHGIKMLENFLQMRSGTWSDQPEFQCKSSDSGILKSQLPPHIGPTASILLKIRNQRVEDVLIAKQRPGQTLQDLQKLALSAPPPIDAFDRLVSSINNQENVRLAVMAEVKRASPSKGNIASTVNAGEQALIYAKAGASLVSVLTEPKWFKGNLTDLRQARDSISFCPHRPALLRKDFIVDEYQLYEARIFGADTVLLIVAILSDDDLYHFLQLSRDLGMEPVVEVASGIEWKRALKAGARIVGINNRDLHSFKVDATKTVNVLQNGSPEDVIVCALSGIQTWKDASIYAEAGARAVLVGEALMRSLHPAQLIHELALCKDLKNEQLMNSNPLDGTETLVKICGVRTPEAAVAAVEAGADLLGIIFAPKSRRRVSIERAKEIVSAARKAFKSFHFQSAHAEENSRIPDKDANWFEVHRNRLQQMKGHQIVIVGVFQNQTIEFVANTSVSVGLDLIQLHGNEPDEYAQWLPRPVIRAFHISGDVNDINETKLRVQRAGYHSYVLLDAKVKLENQSEHQGGQGTAFDWTVVQPITTHNDGYRTPFILAGGLNVYNVSQAISQVQPWIVDVSSGVESGDGEQDLTLIHEFVKRVKSFV